MAELNTLGAGERQSIYDSPVEIDKAALILAAISQVANDAHEGFDNVHVAGNWLTLIEAASSEAHRLLTGLPLHSEGGAILPLVSEVSQAKLSTVESTNQSTQFKLHLDRDTAAKLNPFVGITCWEDTASNVRGGLEFLARAAEVIPEGVSIRAAYGLDLTMQAMANALAFETEGGSNE